MCCIRACKFAPEGQFGLQLRLSSEQFGGTECSFVYHVPGPRQMVRDFQKLEYLFCVIIVCSKILQNISNVWRQMVKEFAENDRTECWLWLVMLESDNFCVDSVIFLTSYAVVCSNVVLHNSDHNWLHWNSRRLTTDLNYKDWHYDMLCFATSR